MRQLGGCCRLPQVGEKSTHTVLGAGGSSRGLHPPLLPELLPSRAARICFPEERPRELLRRLASFLGVAPRAESSSRAALYSSIFSSKPGPDSVLEREEETPHAGSEHNQDPSWLAEAPSQVPGAASGLRPGLRAPTFCRP